MKIILLLTTLAGATTAALAAGTCTVEKDMDYYGGDLSNFQGPATACCDACSTTPECVAYTWSDFAGGTCWLKKVVTNKVAAPGKTSAVIVSSTLSCSPLLQQTDFYGGDLFSAKASKAEDCCDICKKVTGCAAWTFTAYNSGTCWLKNTKGTATYSNGATSGYLIVDNGKCKLEQDKDYTDNDVGSAKGQVFQCCDLCLAEPTCFVWTWSDYQGGTCWLKSKKGTAIDAKGKVSGVTDKPQPLTCTILNGYDLDDNDLTNKPGKVTDCCTLCQTVDKCVAWSWSSYNGGTCWLKGSAVKAVLNPAVTSGLVGDFTLPPEPKCNTYDNTDIPDNDLSNVSGKKVTECCGICAATKGCAAWSYSDLNGGTCWLKSKIGYGYPKTGVTSGVPSTEKLSPLSCSLISDIDIVDSDIGSANSPDAKGCCILCALTPNCVAYTWTDFNSGTCWFKSGYAATVKKDKAVSSVLSGAALPSPKALRV